MSLFNTPPLSGNSGGASQPLAQAGSPQATPASVPVGLAEVREAVPSSLRPSVTQAFVDQLNNIALDPMVAESVRNNFISFSRVLSEGKFKLEDYLNAVAYVSYKMMGMSNGDAYQHTFPNRYKELLLAGRTEKDISAYVHAYAKGKLVNLIMEQTLVPTWVLNAHVFQEAINTQVDLMRNASSEKVRTEAANSLLTHLKKPEKTAQVSIEMGESKGLIELKNALMDMASMQAQLIKDGGNIKDVTGHKLIEGSAKDVSGN